MSLPLTYLWLAAITLFCIYYTCHDLNILKTWLKWLQCRLRITIIFNESRLDNWLTVAKYLFLFRLCNCLTSQILHNCWLWAVMCVFKDWYKWERIKFEAMCFFQICTKPTVDWIYYVFYSLKSAILDYE